ncbi:MAG: hypothetical protein QM767_00395 [Anaeromyxobacter sp.]
MTSRKGGRSPRPLSGTAVGVSRISKMRSPAARPCIMVWPCRPSCLMGW